MKIVNKQHKSIVAKVAKDTGVHPHVVSIIIKRFFWSLNLLMQRNFNVYLHGIMSLTMTKKKRAKIKHEGQQMHQEKFNKRRNRRRKLRTQKAKKQTHK